MFKYILKKYSVHIEIISLILCIFLIYKLIMLFIQKLQEQFFKNNKITTSLFFESLQTPFKWCFFAIIALLTLEFINSQFRIVHKFSTITIQYSIIVIFFSWVIIHFCSTIREHAIQRNDIHYDKTSVLAFTQIGTVITIIISILMELQILGVHIAGILAFGGFSGIAVGFASKDLLANFFGAMMIYMDKPFKVGDWISSPEKPIEGEVDSIGWRQTKIMTFEKRPIYVPNSLFSVIIVENPSRMSHRKIEEKILIKHSDFDKINKITDDIKEFLINYPKIDNSQRVTANLITVSHMALEIQIYCYTTHIDSISFGKLKQEILLKSAKIIENNGAEIVEIIATSKIQNV